MVRFLLSVFNLKYFMSEINKTSIVVFETLHSDKTEWGISFDGHNPSAENYFEMLSREDAFRLRDKLSAKYPPVSFNNPIRDPSNKL